MDIYLYIFIIATIIQLCYYIFVFSRLSFYKKEKDKIKTHLPVSVVICAKNEEKNLKENLPGILNQDYENYEVVVVDDVSTDKTATVLKDLKQQSILLKIITLKEKPIGIKGKKYALTQGIKNAKHDIIVLTDADCQPSGNQWLSFMSRNFHKGASIVLGYAPYQKKIGLLNAIIRYDAFFVALQYLSFSLTGRPYMGVGRNLAYSKKLFLESDGFSGHQHIPSGDDDLFVNRVASKANTRIELAPESFMYSEPKKSWRLFFEQKRRHITTGQYYHLLDKFLLGLLHLSYFCLLFFLFLLLFNGKAVLLVISLFFLRLIIQLILFRFSMKSLNIKDLWLLSPLLDFIILIFYSILGFYNLIHKKTEWR